jgi:predicted amidohydrolase
VEWVVRCVEQTSADFVVLPEAVSTGFTPGVEPSRLWRLLSQVPGAITDPIAEVCERLAVHVVAGAYERGPRPGLVYNTAALFGPGGPLGVYRKTHLFAGERADTGGWVTSGEQPAVVDTSIGRIGMMICYDGDFPELARISTVLGAEILVRPSAFLRPADIFELTTRARAYDNHVFVVAANAVGRDPAGVWYFGNSLVVGPTAAVLARGTSQEGWVTAALDTDQFGAVAPGSSHPQLFDHLADRNLSMYAAYGGSLFAPAEAPFPHPRLRAEQPDRA